MAKVGRKMLILKNYIHIITAGDMTLKASVWANYHILFEVYLQQKNQFFNGLCLLLHTVTAACKF